MGYFSLYSQSYHSIITRHSLVERRARDLFFCMFVCSSTISRQPAGRFTPKFACRRTLVPDVSSPLLEVGGPRRAEKGQMKFSLLWESMGNFCILAVFERYLSNACTDPHQILFVYEQCLPTCPLPLWDPSAPGGRGEGELKTQKIGGWSHSCIGQLPFLFFSAMPNVVQYVGHRPAHILV